MTKLVTLVVEDEPAVRAGASEALKDAGFEVIEAVDAKAAIKVLAADAEHVDAVFTDLSMPGSVDGLELAHQVRRRWPWVRLMTTSGRGRPDASKLPGGTEFLPKPYSLKLLAQRLRRLIIRNQG